MSSLTLENVNKAIGRLESINPKAEYAYEEAILSYLTVKKFPILLYDIPEHTMLFRTRTHEKKEFFSTISEISIAENHYVKSFGRCNRPFQSKFYCSENRPTSYMELVEYWASTKNLGDKVYVTIGKWKLKRPLRCLIVTTPNKEERVSAFDIEHGLAMDKFVGDLQGAEKEAYIVFYNYLFSKFSKPAKDDLKTYIITSAYCNLALTHLQGAADGFYYPSVPFGAQGVNFAINYDFLKEGNLELTDVLWNEMETYKNELGMHSFIETNIRQASRIDLVQKAIIWE